MGVQLAYSTFRELTPGELELVSGGAGTEENIYVNGYLGLPGSDFGGWGGNGFGGDYGGNGHWEPGAGTGGSISDYVKEKDQVSDEKRQDNFEKAVKALVSGPAWLKAFVAAAAVEIRNKLLSAVSLENKAALKSSIDRNSAWFAANAVSFLGGLPSGSTPLEAYQSLFGGDDPGITDPNDRNRGTNR